VGRRAAHRWGDGTIDDEPDPSDLLGTLKPMTSA
jgi:hypothetical protein